MLSHIIHEETNIEWNPIQMLKNLKMVNIVSYPEQQNNWGDYKACTTIMQQGRNRNNIPYPINTWLVSNWTGQAFVRENKLW